MTSSHNIAGSQHHHHDVDEHDHHDPLGDIMMSQHVDEAVADYIAGAGEDDDVSHEYH